MFKPLQFANAIVRLPCKNMIKGLRNNKLGTPDHPLALHQHGAYVDALRKCGLKVRVLPADEKYPDSTFVEDTALLTPELAVLTNPGAASRQGETMVMHNVLKEYYDNIAVISPPGTIDGGDVMMAGKHFLIGLSDRTNLEGAEQLIRILQKHGMSASIIEFSGMLHLKSGISYLENNNMLAIESFKDHPDFNSYNMITVPPGEEYAANSLWINGNVLVPEGYPGTLDNIQQAGYNTLLLDMSEFQKLDGGLSCLSLRFQLPGTRNRDG